MKMKGMGLGTPLDPFAPGDLGPMDLDGELPQAIHERQEAAAQADGAGFGPMMGSGAATSLIREELTKLARQADAFQMETSSMLHEDSLALEQVRGQLVALEQKAALFESEAVKIVSACRGYEAALHNLNGQMQALQRGQMGQTLRALALDKAVQSVGSHAKPDDIVQRAEAFYRFLAAPPESPATPADALSTRGGPEDQQKETGHQASLPDDGAGDTPEGETPQKPTIN